MSALDRCRCRRYSYVDESAESHVSVSNVAVDGVTLDGDPTQRFTDSEILHAIGVGEMAFLNRRQVHHCDCSGHRDTETQRD